MQMISSLKFMLSNNDDDTAIDYTEKVVDHGKSVMMVCIIIIMIL